MRPLSSTLLAAQKSGSAVPAFRCMAYDRYAGTRRLAWTRLYTGPETDSFHAATMPADGALCRFRIDPAQPPAYLFRQRVASPGPGSDFSQWVSSGWPGYRADSPIAAASQGQEIIVFVQDTSDNIWEEKSTDNGSSWARANIQAAGGQVTGMAADYKANGDIALFYTVGNALYVKKRVSGAWQAPAAWPYAATSFKGIAVRSDADTFYLVAAGRDTGNDWRLWTAHYDWSVWLSFAVVSQAPASSGIELSRPSIGKPDTWRLFYVDSFTGTPAVHRPHQHIISPGQVFHAGFWQEANPFDFTSAYGLVLASGATHAWLAHPQGVWRAPAAVSSLDLSADVVAAREEISTWSASLVLDLDNSTGKYHSPGTGSIAVLALGAELVPEHGYVGTAGAEYSSGPRYWTVGLEHVSEGGKAVLRVHAAGGIHLVQAWTARQSWRWNAAGSEKSLWGMVQWVLARAGLGSDVVSSSGTATTFDPDFAIQPGQDGRSVLRRLFRAMPDVLRFDAAYGKLVNPQAADASTYSYGGSGHPLTAGRYVSSLESPNWAQAGSRTADVQADAFSWTPLQQAWPLLQHDEDRELDTQAKAEARGAAVLRGAAIAAGGGYIDVPANAGQELFDVVEVTDARAGLSAARRRITGITTTYGPRKGDYRQRLMLGSV